MSFPAVTFDFNKLLDGKIYYRSKLASEFDSRPLFPSQPTHIMYIPLGHVPVDRLECCSDTDAEKDEKELKRQHYIDIPIPHVFRPIPYTIPPMEPVTSSVTTGSVTVVVRQPAELKAAFDDRAAALAQADINVAAATLHKAAKDAGAVSFVGVGSVSEEQKARETLRMAAALAHMGRVAITADGCPPRKRLRDEK
jgi:hypothetical protein